MAEGEIYDLLSELDAERESSATAASEALSMILRLQGEKAAVTMESEQYRRLTEEKMRLAEDSLEIIEDIIYQKDMEIASLKFQVQAYRCKLLSIGCTDIDFDEPKDESARIGRRNSASLVKYKKAFSERANSTGSEIESISKIVKGSSDSLKIDDDSNFYWESIRKLDLRVKEIARSYTMPPLCLGSSADPVKEMPQICSTIDETVNTNNGTVIHDVFEVPQADRDVIVHPQVDGASEPLLEFNTKTETREVERSAASTSTTNKEEEFSFLNEIKEHLHSLLRSWTAPRDDPSLYTLREAMLYFWL